jgi:hypothetical protein
MITVHIGLGKCASTSLQRFVFTNMVKINSNIEFNNKELLFLARKHHLLTLSIKEKSKFDKILHNGKDHLISAESLINWDPERLEEAADLNLELFGGDANIIIVVRESMSYFTSVYQQTIHEGNVIAASDFFVKPDVYDRIRPLSGQNSKLKFFNAKEFSLKKIYSLYTERFDYVFFVPLSKVNDLLFLKEIYNITDNEMKILKNRLAKAPKANKSYSSLAMKLTFQREKILNALGLKSYGSWDGSLLEGLSFNGKIPFSKLLLIDKIKQLPIRIIGRIIRQFTWRLLMQDVIDKITPYRKYKLPKGLPILQENLNKDSIFLKKIEKECDILLKIGKIK